MAEAKLLGADSCQDLQSLSLDISRMLGDDSNSDITFIVGPYREKIPAHSLILSGSQIQAQ
jgi:hypothetical protein